MRGLRHRAHAALSRAGPGWPDLYLVELRAPETTDRIGRGYLAAADFSDKDGFAGRCTGIGLPDAARHLEGPWFPGTSR